MVVDDLHNAKLVRQRLCSRKACHVMLNIETMLSAPIWYLHVKTYKGSRDPVGGYRRGHLHRNNPSQKADKTEPISKTQTNPNAAFEPDSTNVLLQPITDSFTAAPERSVLLDLPPTVTLQLLYCIWPRSTL